MEALAVGWHRPPGSFGQFGDLFGGWRERFPGGAEKVRWFQKKNKRRESAADDAYSANISASVHHCLEGSG